jgi:hypothetical protein
MTVTIGSLTNVPAPGDDLRSPWAQDVTKLGVHIFATKAALDAAPWPGLVNGAHAWVVDTGKRYVRMGGIWYTPNQILGYASQNVSGAIGTSAVFNPGIGATCPAGRRVRFTAHINCSGGGTPALVAQVTIDGVPSGRIAQMNALPGSGAILTGSVFLAAPTGTHSYGLLVTAGVAGATHESAIDPTWWALEDVGSVTP